MDARQLRYFVTVAQLGSFSAAARRLHVAQPALSRHVKALEEKLGVTLLQRGTRGVRLTGDGEELLGHGSQVLEQLDSLPRFVGPARATITGRVVVGLPTSASAVLAVPLLQATMARFPQIRLHLIESLSGYLQEWIESGRLDLGVVYDPPPHSGIRLDPILQEPLWFVGGRGALPPDTETIDLREVPHYPLVLPAATHATRRLVESIALAHRIRIKLLAEVDSLTVQKDLVATGQVFTILPRGSIHADLQSGRLVAARIVRPTVGRTVTLAASLLRGDDQACNAIARLLLEVARGLVDGGVWHGRLPDADSGPSARRSGR